MTPKEKFLENLKAKIKLYQDAYDYNKGLPDDIFEAINGKEVSLTSKQNPALNGGANLEYGVNIKSVRDIIKEAGEKGIHKQGIMKLFPYDVENKITVITNALSSLNKGNEIEGIKPKGIKIKGFYWRMKN